MARGQATPSVFPPEHAEYAPLLCDIFRGRLTWLFRSGGLSHARRLLPESGRRAALRHAKRVRGGRAVRHAQPAKPAKRRKEDNLGHAKSREPPTVPWVKGFREGGWNGAILKNAPSLAQF